MSQFPSWRGDDGEPPSGEAITPLDLLLKQGTADQLAAMRQLVADEPLLAIEVAETVAVLEQLRQVRVEPSAAYAARLNDLCRRAELRLVPLRPGWRWRDAVWVAAAAGITWALLTWTNPLGRQPQPEGQRLANVAMPLLPQRPALGGEPEGVAPEELLRSRVAQEAELALQLMRHRLDLEATPELRAELEQSMRAPADPLARWLDPRNALVELRLGHEQRASLDVREKALRRAGAMEGSDGRVQQLADSIAAELDSRLRSDEAPPLGDVAFAVRALIAAGSTSVGRTAALQQGTDWLAARLPQANGAELSAGLAALVEVAAVQGRGVDLVTREGSRFLDEVLHVDEDTWGRRLPELLTGRVPTATLAEAGRTVAFLPGFGLDPGRCALMRRLLLGELRQRGAAERGPEPLAGLVYGFADLLSEVERDQIELQLRRWKPARLVPDFATVHQLAWGVEAGRIGFTLLQSDLRRLAVVADPGQLGLRSLLCMSLASSYAAYGVGSLAQLSGD